MAAPLVVARGLSRVHGSGPGARTVLRDVHLEVRAGELVSVVGASGSGKTTLLHLLAGLDRPTRGSVAIDGVDVSRGSEARRARFRRSAVGMVFQSFRLVPELTAWENALMPARLAGDLAGGRERAQELFRLLGVARVGRQLPADLSGGEQQRVAIARALVMQPRVILADEPTGNLDESASADVLALLRDAVGPRRAVVMVTHDAAQAAAADRSVRLRDGRLDG